jgi:hypothetical protein
MKSQGIEFNPVILTKCVGLTAIKSTSRVKSLGNRQRFIPVYLGYCIQIEHI